MRGGRTSNSEWLELWHTTTSCSRIGVPTCPSSVRYTLSSGPREVTRITLVSGTSTGRLVNMCGQIGVMHSAGTVGKMIGPPAESEYAVDPVGVEMISPSALYAHTN